MSAPAAVLVTGASRGIGRAIAEALLRDGRQVAAVARNEALLRELASERCVPLACDVARGAAGLFARAEAALGPIEGVVHAAGAAPHAWLEGVRDEDLDLCHALYVRAPVHLVRDLAARSHERNSTGSAVLVSSTLGLRPARGTLAYSASKAAMIASAKVMALELAPRVRVNVVAPGVVDTEMVRAPRLRPGEPPLRGEARDARIEAELEALRALHPMQRLGTPGEIASAALFLLDAEWVTGTVLTIDGGLTAG